MFYDVKYSITDNDYGSYVFEDYDGYKVLTEDGIHQGISLCWRYYLQLC